MTLSAILIPGCDFVRPSNSAAVQVHWSFQGVHVPFLTILLDKTVGLSPPFRVIFALQAFVFPAGAGELRQWASG